MRTIYKCETLFDINAGRGHGLYFFLFHFPLLRRTRKMLSGICGP